MSEMVDVVLRRGVRVPMRDGVELVADLYLPADDATPRPALLQRTPYDRTDSEMTVVAQGIEPAEAVARGFAVVVQDVRGRYASAGEFAPFEQEGDDGEDTLAWIAAQPWSDGRVVMYGGSYVGATQLLAAVRAPAALRGVMPTMTGDDYHDGWTYRGGALAHGMLVRWLLSALAPEALDRLRRLDPARAAALAGAFDALADDQRAAEQLTPAAFVERLAPLTPYLRGWQERSRRDAWWRSVSVRERAAAVTVPGLHVAGWWDVFLPGTVANFTRLREHAATPQARAGQRLVVGPWTHSAQVEAVGELLLGRRAALASLDTTALQLDFAAAALRGEEPPGPPVRLWTLGAGWREEQAWPPERMREERWLLGGADPAGPRAGGDPLDGGTLAPAGAERDGSRHAPRERPLDGGTFAPAGGERDGGRLAPDERDRSVFVHDPADLVPTVAGATMQPGGALCLVSGPRDRRAVQRRADVLTFTSAPLPEAVELTGPLRAVLWVVTDAPEADVVTTLSLVERDGRALHLSDGIVRLSHRDGPDAPPAPAPRAGEPVRVEVALDPLSVLLAPGTRLRVEVAGSCWPRFAPHPSVKQPTRVELLHTPAYPSHLVLPRA
jgi:putative CocE/NonD family hydrolase